VLVDNEERTSTGGGMAGTGPGTVVVGRYRLVRRLANGGMGVVWLAGDTVLRRSVALKQLHTQPGLSKAEADLGASRAMREARITARLHHPNAVPVYDVVEHDGQPCLIMQYLPSTSLQTALEQMGRLEPGEVARIGADVAGALVAAHQAGIVHRDVKPGNVLIADDGTVKITDFGISHALGDVRLTSTGMVTGTPGFLAPEVARGGESGFASDVFSLGATLYAATEGHSPFGTDDNPMAVLHRAASGQVIPPVHSAALTPLLQRMLSADPDDRPDMLDVYRGLVQVRAGTAGPAAQARTDKLAVAGLADNRTSPLTAALPGAEPPTAKPPTPPADASGSFNGGGRPDRPRRRRRALAGLVILAVVAALTVVTLLRAHFKVTAGPRSHGSTGPSSAESTSAPATTPASSATARTSRPSSTKSSTPPTSQPSTRSGPVTAADLAQAIVTYYALLPYDTDAAWPRLTPRFQAARAGGRQNFNSYWASISRVTVSNTVGYLPDQAQTTITYYYRDGRVITERTTFRLVSVDGVLKIDRQS
jgi:eukaryotic-like serine/threonine-protein kinase